jgi:hypothetical protein
MSGWPVNPSKMERTAREYVVPRGWVVDSASVACPANSDASQNSKPSFHLATVFLIKSSDKPIEWCLRVWQHYRSFDCSFCRK